MTKEEKQARTNTKIKQITDLCDLLKITLTAEEMMFENGIIKKVVNFSDNEKYETITENNNTESVEKDTQPV